MAGVERIDGFFANVRNVSQLMAEVADSKRNRPLKMLRCMALKRL